MAWIFADQSFGTGSKNPLTGSAFIQSTRTIDAPPEHGSFYSQSAQGQIKYIQSKTGGQEVLTTSSPTFQNMTVTGSLRAGAFVVTSSQTSYTASFGSGRSIFGDSSDDQHSLTGSLEISGGLEVLHYDLSGSNQASMSIGQFAGSGSGIQNVQVPQADHIPLNTWKGSVTALQLPSGSRSTQPPGQRGLIAGGGSDSVDIYFVTLSTPADALDFGDLTDGKEAPGVASNGVHDRGVAAGGYPYSNIIDYVTISTAANAIDFGDLTISKYGIAGASNGPNERAVFMGGAVPGNKATADIDYITISTPGNSNDFGDLISTTYYVDGTDNGVHDRGVIFGGKPASTDIEFITISTTGNAHDFGDLTSVKTGTGATSNDINDRAVTAGDAPGTNVIEMITIPTPGNANDFGDLTRTVGYEGSTSNGTDERGIFSGGNPANNIIDYITISVPGNALDFGDLPANRNQNKALSNAAVPIWPYENALDSATLYTSQSAASYSSITGSYLHISASTQGTSGGHISGSSGTLVEEITSGSLAISSNRPPGQIGVVAGGNNPVVVTMDYIQINSPGDAVDFGDLVTGRKNHDGASNGIAGRAVFGGGNSPDLDSIDYITMTSPGNASLFGSLSMVTVGPGATDNGPNQRAVFLGGTRTGDANDVIDYITVSTLGDAFDFGNLTGIGTYCNGLSNGVNDRGIRTAGLPVTNVMDYITISTPSDATDFGDLSEAKNAAVGLSNDTNERGIIAGGTKPAQSNVIDFITISSAGNGLDFGDVTGINLKENPSGLSNGRGERGVLYGTYPADATMEFITINSPGNSINFGESTLARYGGAGATNGASFYPHAAYPQTRFSTDPMTVIQSKTEVSFASGSLQHYIASGGLFSIPNITPSASSADGPQSGSNSFVQNFPEGAIGRTGVFEVWAGLVPDQVANLTGSSPAFTQLALGYNATGSIGTLHGFSGSSAFYASASVYNAYNVSASFSSGSSATSDSASAGRIAATALPGTNTIYRGEWKTVASGSALPGQRGVNRGSSTLGYEYITISTTGNSVDFGDGVHTLYGASGTSNGTNGKGIIAGGNHKSIEHITINTPGNASDFGDLLANSGYSSGMISNGPDDRGVIWNDSTAVEYVTISSPANAADFGSSTFNTQGQSTPITNGVNQRGLKSKGYPIRKNIEAFTISSRGNGWYFGDAISYCSKNGQNGASNDTDQRGVSAAGDYVGGPTDDTIDYVTISTLGNALDFGDTLATNHTMASTSNGIDGRMVTGGGLNTGAALEYVSLSTPANTVDFGDLIVSRYSDGDNSSAFISDGATPNTVSGSSVSVGPTFFSGSIAYASGSTSGKNYAGVNYWNLTRGTGAITGSVLSNSGSLVQASALSTGSMVVMTDRIMNTTGSGADASSSLLDFTSRSPGQRTVTGYTHSATDKTLLDAITMTSLGNAAIHGYNLHNTGTNLFGCGVSNGTGDRALHRHHGTDYQCMTISTPGNASTFGNDSATFTSAVGATSNGTDQRGVIYYNHYEYVTISTLGNAIGASSTSGYNKGMLGSNGRNQRGIIKNSTTARFMYFTISSLGNALDFGATTGTYYNGMTTNDTNDRLVHHPVNGGVVDYITISTPSDALDFGNNIFGDNGSESFSNGTGGRGFNVGDDGAEKATIAYYDIGNLGDSQVFGDLSQMATSQQGFASSNSAL